MRPLTEGDPRRIGPYAVLARIGEGAPHELLYRTVQEAPVLDGLGPLTTLVAACLDKDPARRPTAEAVLSALAGDMPPHGVEWLPPDAWAVVTRPVEIPAVPSGRPRVDRRTLLLGGGGAVLAAVGVPVLWPDGSSSHGGAWTYDPKEHLAGPLAVTGGLVLAAAGGGGLHAIDVRTGARRWVADGLGLTEISKPTAVPNGGVIVLKAESMYGLDARTGDQRWHVPASPSDDLPPVLAGGHAYAFSDSRTLAAYDPASGAQRFTVGFDLGPLSGPTAVNGSLYVGSGGETNAVEAATGRILWRTTVQAKGSDAAGLGPPIADGDAVYTLTAGKTVVALDARTGKRRWRSTAFASSDRPGLKAALAFGFETLYLVVSDGQLLAFNPQDGRPRWRYSFGPNTTIEPVDCRPVESGGLTFSACPGVLVALDTASGAVRRRFTQPVSLERAQPLLVRGRLHILMGGSVRTFDPATGRVLRTRSVPDAQQLVTDGVALYVNTPWQVKALPA